MTDHDHRYALCMVCGYETLVMGETYPCPECGPREAGALRLTFADLPIDVEGSDVYLAGHSDEALAREVYDSLQLGTIVDIAITYMDG